MTDAVVHGPSVSTGSRKAVVDHEEVFHTIIQGHQDRVDHVGTV